MLVAALKLLKDNVKQTIRKEISGVVRL
jgi:hypothetical protein